MFRFAVLLLLALPAHATIITIDAADFAPGSLINGPGISLIRGIVGPAQPLNSPTQAVFDTAITSVRSTSELVPPAFFSGSYSYLGDSYHCYNRFLQGQSPGSCNEGWSVLEVNFDAPTDYIEVIGGFGDSLGAGFMAFDSLGQIVGQCGGILGPSVCSSTEWLGEGAFRITANFSSALVSRVWFGNSNLDRVVVSSFSYSIPEPATLALMGLGLLGVAFGARRKAR